MKTISTQTLVALSKSIATELESRDSLIPGTHNVHDSLSLDLNGTIVVNEKELYTPTISIPLKVTMALFMRYSGITGDLALNALEKAMTDALNLDKSAQKSIQEIAVLDKTEKKVKAMLGELPKAERNGKTFVDVEVTYIHE